MKTAIAKLVTTKSWKKVAEASLVDHDLTGQIPQTDQKLIPNEPVVEGVRKRLKKIDENLLTDLDSTEQMPRSTQKIVVDESAGQDMSQQSGGNLNGQEKNDDKGAVWWYAGGAAALIGGGVLIANSGSDNAAVVIPTPTPAPVNQTPVAIADAITVDEDTTNNTINVLKNDTDADGDSLTVVQAQAAHGSVTVNKDGTLNYTPEANYFGQDTIQYTIDDGKGGQASSNVIVSVTQTPIAVNQKPVAIADAITVDEDTTNNTINVLKNDTDADGDSLTVVQAQATHGSVTVNKDGTLNYTPEANYFGQDTIQYTIDDGKGGQASSNVIVFVTQTPIAVNQKPVAIADAITVDEDTTNNTINVLKNDTDADGDSLTVVQAQAAHGSVSINADGTLNYTSEANYFGQDTIQYMIDDGKGGQASSYVNVTINDVAELSENRVGYFKTDISSGADAAVTTLVDSQGRLIVIGADESLTSEFIYNLGHILVLRYLPDGTLDRTFGTDGVVKHSIDGLGVTATLDSSGRIVVAGCTPTDAILVRMNADGSLDSSFSADGIVAQDFNHGKDGSPVHSDADFFQKVLMDDQGRILVVGTTEEYDPKLPYTINSSDVVVQRYLTNGELDASFGNNGTVLLDDGVFGYNRGSVDMVLTESGKIVVAGNNYLPNPDYTHIKNGFLVQLNTDGSFDSGFGHSGNGINLFDVGTQTLGGSTTSFGRVVSDVNGGYYTVSDDSDIVHFGSDGLVDTSYGVNGVVNHQPIAHTDYVDVNSVVSDSVGRAIVLIDVDSGNQDILMRFDTNGVLDNSFSDDGLLTLPQGLLGLSITPDQGDGFYLSGMMDNQLSVWKFLENGTLDTTFGMFA